LLPGAQSVIVLGLGYAPPLFVNLSTLATNPDYHKKMETALHELAALLELQTYKVLADSPYLDERALAVQAGLGFYGRHGLVVSPALGSYFNIGCIITSTAIDETPVPPYSGCPQGCRLCLEACPAGRDKLRCISYLTQKRGILSREETDMLNGQLYGCDICQRVCPFNKANPPGECFPPGEWLTASDAALREKYGHTAMWWRGPEIMRRNAAALR
jgi:epoxyqueuosine reductase